MGTPRTRRRALLDGAGAAGRGSRTVSRRLPCGGRGPRRERTRILGACRRDRLSARPCEGRATLARRRRRPVRRAGARALGAVCRRRTRPHRVRHGCGTSRARAATAFAGRRKRASRGAGESHTPAPAPGWYGASPDLFRSASSFATRFSLRSIWRSSSRADLRRGARNRRGAIRPSTSARRALAWQSDSC